MVPRVTLPVLTPESGHLVRPSNANGCCLFISFLSSPFWLYRFKPLCEIRECLREKDYPTPTPITLHFWPSFGFELGYKDQYSQSWVTVKWSPWGKISKDILRRARYSDGAHPYWPGNSSEGVAMGSLLFVVLLCLSPPVLLAHIASKPSRRPGTASTHLVLFIISCTIKRLIKKKLLGGDGAFLPVL